MASPHQARLFRFGPPLLLIAVLAAVYAPVSGFDFVQWDDGINIFANPHFQPVNAENVLRFWTSPYSKLYVPIPYTVWAGLCVVGAVPPGSEPLSSLSSTLNPAVFHLFNLFVHIINTLLVWKLLSRFFPGKNIALAGAMLWAIHPLQVESVAWASELRGLLSHCFGLAALNLHFHRGVNGLDRGTWPRRLTALLCFVFALLSKPSAVCFPLLAWGLDLGLCRRGALWPEARRAALQLSPWLLACLPFVLISSGAQPVPPELSPPAGRPLVALDALAFYIGKLLYPENFQMTYGRTPASLFREGFGYYTWILPVGLMALAFTLRRRFPQALTALFIFVAGLLPTLGLVPFIYQEYSTVADRYAYLAMLAPALLLCATLTWWNNKRVKQKFIAYGVPIACALWLSVLAVRTAQHVPNWKNNSSLWSYNLNANPLNATMWNNIGTLLLDQGKTREALAYFQRAAEITPKNPNFHANIGDAQLKMGNREAAKQKYEQALKILPNIPEAQVALGNILREEGKGREAIEHYEAALRYESKSALAHYNLGQALQAEGKLPEAQSHLEQAIAITPDDAAAHDTLALVLAKQGNTDAALEHWNQAVTLNPRYAPAHINLGTLLAMQGNYEAAAEHWRQAIRLDPNNAQVHHNLATLLMATGHKAQAIAHWKTALRLMPNYAQARAALSRAIGKQKP